ncbi:glycerophosphodiester phosphodiesterase family protein [Rhodococcoides fascians]|jgi:glycerophosphoryl diester phosphodiesterase|uniref:glycerophosphodiester phosphodiesterase family protein n=1 Tax=Rhodococcoides fascians TaxID=1828 RepID=UPI001E63D8B4|nr:MULTISPECIES: glycerophosphodiester phosphodiesterase family protein [Rhodococcus]
MGCGTGSATDRALPEESFDLQAHRGGLGLVTESTIESFTNALQLGVSTLELDTQITEDGIAIVTHDRKVSDSKCVDTGALVPGDPEFPYVGKFVNTLTLAQIRTLDCGALPLTDYPEQRRVPGARMPTLTEVLNLVKSADASGVKLNVETKVEAGSPTETAPREQFVDTVLGTVRDAGMLDRITVQSFDWGALTLVRDAEPEVPVVALTNGDFLQVGQDGASPWLGGIDIDDFGGDAIAAIDSFGASAYSPVQGTPQNGKVGDPDFELYVTQDMVNSAHERGIRVIPWTVDDPDTMRALMDLGVDGLITDYPDRLRAVMSERGLSLPEPAR